MSELQHDLYMGEEVEPKDRNDWDFGLDNDQLIDRVTDQLLTEGAGDVLTIRIRTYEVEEEEDRGEDVLLRRRRDRGGPL